MEWLIILAVSLAAFAAGAVYLVVCIGRLSFVQKIADGRKWMNRAVSAVITASVFAVLIYLLSFVNAVVVYLHLVIFFLIGNLVFHFLQKKTGKSFGGSTGGLIVLGFTAIWLTAGFYQDHHVWQTDYYLQTAKNVGTVKVALIADSHLGTTFDGVGFAKHLETIEKQKPDALLIAGDFVDDASDRADLQKACEALGRTHFPYGVWYVYGNHDRGYGQRRDFSAADLAELLRQNNVHILEDEYAEVGEDLIIAGRQDASRNRKTADELLSDADAGRYIILLDHQPNDYENESLSSADLVLSGHTHGGQLIPINRVGELFRLNDRTYGHESRNGTDFIVTSGISAWEILFKTGTRSEYVIITIEGK